MSDQEIVKLQSQQKLAVIAGFLALTLSLVHAGFAVFNRGGAMDWGFTCGYLFVGVVWGLVLVRWKFVGFLQAMGSFAHGLLVMLVFYDNARSIHAGFHTWMMHTSLPLYHLYLMHISIYSILLAIYFIEPQFRQDLTGKCAA